MNLLFFSVGSIRYPQLDCVKYYSFEHLIRKLPYSCPHSPRYISCIHSYIMKGAPAPPLCDPRTHTYIHIYTTRTHTVAHRFVNGPQKRTNSWLDCNLPHDPSKNLYGTSTQGAYIPNLPIVRTRPTIKHIIQSHWIRFFKAFPNQYINFES